MNPEDSPEILTGVVDPAVGPDWTAVAAWGSDPEHRAAAEAVGAQISGGSALPGGLWSVGTYPVGAATPLTFEQLRALVEANRLSQVETGIHQWWDSSRATRRFRQEYENEYVPPEEREARRDGPPVRASENVAAGTLLSGSGLGSYGHAVGHTTFNTWDANWGSVMPSVERIRGASADSITVDDDGLYDGPLLTPNPMPESADFAALWAGVLRAEGDSLPKLVAADWLDENDRPTEAYALRWCGARGLWPERLGSLFRLSRSEWWAWRDPLSMNRIARLPVALWTVVSGHPLRRRQMHSFLSPWDAVSVLARGLELLRESFEIPLADSTPAR
jgi:uncharacterized protein (TIGR02996 family)